MPAAAFPFKPTFGIWWSWGLVVVGLASVAWAMQPPQAETPPADNPPAAAEPAPSAPPAQAEQSDTPAGSEDSEEPADPTAKDQAESPDNGGEPEDDPRVEAIIERAEAFVIAYNERDFEALAELFDENVEVYTSRGHEFTGLDEVLAGMEATFLESPEAKISLTLESVRFLTDEVAIETGITTFYADGKNPTSRSLYSLTHVLSEGGWRIAAAKTIREATITPYERLNKLSWLLGEWIDESTDAVVEFSCRWDANFSFLLMDYVVRREGYETVRGTQRIGWDPQAETIRSWMFDSNGGFSQAVWTPVEGSWINNARGVRSDGTPISMTRVLTPLGEDHVVLLVTNHLEGNQLMPETEVTLVRRPPPPGSVDASPGAESEETADQP